MDGTILKGLSVKLIASFFGNNIFNPFSLALISSFCFAVTVFLSFPPNPHTSKWERGSGKMIRSVCTKGTLEVMNNFGNNAHYIMMIAC